MMSTSPKVTDLLYTHTHTHTPAATKARTVQARTVHAHTGVVYGAVDTWHVFQQLRPRSYLAFDSLTEVPCRV